MPIKTPGNLSIGDFDKNKQKKTKHFQEEILFQILNLFRYPTEIPNRRKCEKIVTNPTQKVSYQ